MKQWQPRPDQGSVLQWLDGRRRALVCAPCGSGKTVITATWLSDLMHDRFAVGRALIVAPPIPAMTGWIGELRKWDHLQDLAGDARVLTAEDFGLGAGVAVTAKQRGKVTTKVVHKAQAADLDPDLWDVRKAGHAFVDRKGTKRHLQGLTERLHIVSWSFWPWLVKAYGANWPYDAVVFDESGRLRDGGSEAWRAAAWALRKVNRPPRYVLELNATPVANHVEAGRSQLDLLEAGCLGSTVTEFREQWCAPDRRNWQTGMVYSWRLGEHARPAFEGVVERLAISVPPSLATPLVVSAHRLALPEVTKAAYDEMEANGVWDGIVAGSEAVRHLKLRQLARGFVYRQDLGDSDGKDAVRLDRAKLEKLDELLEAIEGPVVVVFEFEEEMASLKERYARQVRDIRERGAKEAFEAGKLRMLAIHPKSAAHGVDGLQTVCNNIVWLGACEDADLWEQANGRVHRHGTNAPTVFAHVLLAEGTVEERIHDSRIPEKLAEQQRMLDAASVARKMQTLERTAA